MLTRAIAEEKSINQNIPKNSRMAYLNTKNDKDKTNEEKVFERL